MYLPTHHPHACEGYGTHTIARASHPHHHRNHHLRTASTPYVVSRPHPKRYDADGSGSIDAKELESLLKDLDFNIRNKGTVKHTQHLRTRGRVGWSLFPSSKEHTHTLSTVLIESYGLSRARRAHTLIDYRVSTHSHSGAQIQLIYRRLDKDNDGSIDLEELSTWWVCGLCVCGCSGVWVRVAHTCMNPLTCVLRCAQVGRDGTSYGKTRSCDREK